MHIDRFGAVQRLLFDPAQANYLDEVLQPSQDAWRISLHHGAVPGRRRTPPVIVQASVARSYFVRVGGNGIVNVIGILKAVVVRSPSLRTKTCFPPASELLRPAKEPRFPASAETKNQQ